MQDEWQERPPGQTSYALGLGWLVLGLVDLGLLVPGRHGLLQLLTFIAGVFALALALRYFREARRLSR